MLSGGSIFAREGHRVTPLTQALGDQRWEHVHMVLDKVVVEKPSARLSLNDFRRELRKVRDLVMGNYAPLKPSIGIKCRFCGLGTYARVGKDRSATALVPYRQLTRIQTRATSIVRNECSGVRELRSRRVVRCSANEILVDAVMIYRCAV